MGDLVKKAPQTGFNTSFYGKSPNRIYGLLQCQGNISKQDCSICSQQANDSVIKLCGNEVGGRVWMDNCFLRYEKFDFISKLDTNGNYLENVNDISISSNIFRSTTSDLLSYLSDQAYAPANEGFADGTVEDYSFGTVYGLVQCWRDISIKDCKSCLQLARSNLYQCCSIKQGAQAMLGTCTVRYEIYPFFDTPSGGNSTSPSPPPRPSAASRANPPTVAAHAPSAKGTSRTTSKGSSSKTLPIILGILGGVVLAFMVCLFAMWRRWKSAISPRQITHAQKEETHENDPELTLLNQEQILFTLEALTEATDNFDENKKLGEGGFGPVYKKRKGNSSEEVVYPEKKRHLDWHKRYNIIMGIARGLLYLHEDSQLRIIHRDIKANNILLDEGLNAKIADFGGYMAPEYAMQGQLSVKVDVYSFGVLVLEIISARKNSDANLPDEMQSLLEWAWRLYKRGCLLDMIDTTLTETCRQEQALRCIQVGLLCTQADAGLRPILSNVILMISSASVTLANPTKPAFVESSDSSRGGSTAGSASSGIQHSRSSATVSYVSSASPQNPLVPSLNDVTISELEAR
eukprot:PITA_22372